jgi:Flp pilus assembly protein TadG
MVETHSARSIILEARRPAAWQGWEQGQALTELLLILPVALLLVFALIFFGRAFYVKLAVEAAAADAARMAVETLDSQLGPWQGVQAAYNTLSGYHLNPSGASVFVQPRAAWGRGTTVDSRVAYPVFTADIPFLGSVFPSVEVSGRASLQVEKYKSRWIWR